MKRMMLVGAAALALMATEAGALSLAEASARIKDAIDDGNGNVMASLVEQLSPSDQVTFLNRVNAAVAAKPGAPATKVADYLNVNGAAIRAAKSSHNCAALLAETFATVPPEALTVINERFASELFNRNANAAQPVGDDRMTNIAVSVMKKIAARNAAADNPDVRNAFAALMFIRASNGTPASLREALLNELSAESRETARNEWFPAALGEGQPKSYEPMLGASDAGEQPDFALVARLATAEAPVALLADLGGKPGDIAAVRATLGPGFASLPNGLGSDSGLDRIPRSLDSDDPWFGGRRRGEGEGGGGNGGGGHSCAYYSVGPGSVGDGHRCAGPTEPGGYTCQLLCGER